MPRVKSAKGKIVDFDLLKIKRGLAGKPVSIDVKARQAFIDQKARRRLRKITKQASAAAIDVDSEVLAAVESTATQPMIDVQPKTQVVDITATQTIEEKHNTKQKVRPSKE
ncbi:MAG: hypothetical protein KGI25_09810 [Thaumarchaeota archaeon]|nr:hypothetical protein [Nitrososphaerota archaeon]